MDGRREGLMMGRIGVWKELEDESMELLVVGFLCSGEGSEDI